MLEKKYLMTACIQGSCCYHLLRTIFKLIIKQDDLNSDGKFSLGEAILHLDLTSFFGDGVTATFEDYINMVGFELISLKLKVYDSNFLGINYN